MAATPSLDRQLIDKDPPMNDFNPKLKGDLKHLDLPQPDQIGFVVRDLDEAIALDDPAFGPFHKTDFGVQQAQDRGGPAAATTEVRLRPNRRY